MDASERASRGLYVMLDKVVPLDPVARAGSATLLATAVLLACYLPARRATRVVLVELKSCLLTESTQVISQKQARAGI